MIRLMMIAWMVSKEDQVWFAGLMYEVIARPTKDQIGYTVLKLENHNNHPITIHVQPSDLMEVYIPLM